MVLTTEGASPMDACSALGLPRIALVYNVRCPLKWMNAMRCESAHEIQTGKNLRNRKAKSLLMAANAEKEERKKVKKVRDQTLIVLLTGQSGFCA